MCPKEAVEVAAIETAYVRVEIENHSDPEHPRFNPIDPKFKLIIQHGRIIESFPECLKQQDIDLSLNPERSPARFINVSAIARKVSPWVSSRNPYTTRILSGPDNQPETNLIVCVPTVVRKSPTVVANFPFELMAQGLVRWSHVLKNLSLHFITPGGVQVINDVAPSGGVQAIKNVLSQSLELEAEFFQNGKDVLMEVVDSMRAHLRFFDNRGHVLVQAGPLTLMVDVQLENKKTGVIESQGRFKASAWRIVNKGRMLTQVGAMTLTADERFDNLETGHIESQDKLKAEAWKIVNKGCVVAHQEIELVSKTALENVGDIGAFTVQVEAEKIVQSAKEAQLVGIERLMLNAQSEVQNAGLFLGDTVDITAPIKINNQEGAKIQGGKRIQLNSEEIVNAGQITSPQEETKLSVEIEARTFQNGESGFLEARDCSIAAERWVNKGTVVATTLGLEGLKEDENSFENTGTVKTTASMDLSCRVLKNHHFLESSKGSIQVLDADQIIQSSGGRMISGQNLTLRAKNILENEGAISGKKVTLTTLNPSSSLKNLSTGFMKAKQEMQWITPTTETAENAGEIVVETGKFTLKQSRQFDNTKTGRVLAPNLNIDVTVLNNQGVLGSSRQLKLRAKQLANRGVITAQAGVANLCNQRTPELSSVQKVTLGELQAGRWLQSPVSGQADAAKSSSNAAEEASERERKVDADDADLDEQQALGVFWEENVLLEPTLEAFSMPIKRKIAGEAIEQYEVNVPGDGSCLFYSVAFAYLLPVVNKPDDFKQRFEKLFGPEAKESAEDNRAQLLDYDGSSEFIQTHQATLEVLVNVSFRSRVVDFMRKHQKELEEFINTENGGDLCLISELPQTKKPEPRKLYLEKQGDKLKYIAGSDAQGDSIIEGTIDIPVPGELTKEFLNKKKAEILEITSKRGHTPAGETFESRMSRMGDCKVKAWGDQPEIEAMSRFLKVNIKLWQDQGEMFVPEVGADHGSHHSDKINLVHANRNHYHYLTAALPRSPKEAAEASTVSNSLISERKEDIEKVAQNRLQSPLILEGVENASNLPSQSEIKAVAEKLRIPLSAPKPSDIRLSDSQNQNPPKSPVRNEIPSCMSTLKIKNVGAI